jgi:glycosyltransferase involved in cell wall biosynthesis
MASMPSLAIAQVAPPFEPVPPAAYGGTERVVDALTRELVRRGHRVTVFASGDSSVPCELVETVPRALRAAGFVGDPSGHLAGTALRVLARAEGFDLIHDHLGYPGLVMAANAPRPVVSTFHGRLDDPLARQALPAARGNLVAISRAQAATHPGVRWAGVVHNGLDLAGAPFDHRRSEDLVFVGRITPEKGVVDAIEVARITGRPLRIVAKVGASPAERAYAETVFEPALARADVEFLGELGGDERDRLLASSFALLMPSAWPEPFGLTAIEALACGTPVIARQVGALPEIIRAGVDGFFGDDAVAMAFHVDRVGELDRAAIRERVLDEFSARRMADAYEDVYARVLGLDRASHQPQVIPWAAGACTNWPLPPRHGARRSTAMGTLSAKKRDALPDRAFGLPEKRLYPMTDKAHARNAKARAAQQQAKGDLTRSEKKRIDSKADRILGE